MALKKSMKLINFRIINIIGLLLFVVIVWTLLYRFTREGFGTEESIPKQIWTFWDSENIPEIVKQCVDTWKKHNPDYKITIVNKSNLSTYLPEVDFSKIKHIEDSATRFSDMVRIHLLDKYGGIWSDSSVICLKSYDSLIRENPDFMGFYIDAFTLPEMKDSSPVIENWFFACRKGSILVHDWLTEFLRISDYDTIEQYVDAVKSEGVNIQNIDSPSYLSMHIACQKVLQKGPNKPYHYNLIKADDTAFKYLTMNGWDSEKAIQNILDCKSAASKNCDLFNSPIIKFRGVERGFIEKNDYTKRLFD
jgi:mannosyltransferase OCH1-like enzyme